MFTPFSCYFLFLSECVCAVHGSFTSEYVYSVFMSFFSSACVYAVYGTFTSEYVYAVFISFFSSECVYAAYGTFTSEYVYAVLCFNVVVWFFFWYFHEQICSFLLLYLVVELKSLMSFDVELLALLDLENCLGSKPKSESIDFACSYCFFTLFNFSLTTLASFALASFTFSSSSNLIAV